MKAHGHFIRVENHSHLKSKPKKPCRCFTNENCPPKVVSFQLNCTTPALWKRIKH